MNTKKLTDRQIKQVHFLHTQRGLSYSQLAQQFHVDKKTIGNYVNSYEKKEGNNPVLYDGQQMPDEFHHASVSLIKKIGKMANTEIEASDIKKLTESLLSIGDFYKGVIIDGEQEKSIEDMTIEELEALRKKG